MPARACGTMRTPEAATMNRNTARTISATRPASMASSFLLLGDERRGALDLDDVYACAGLEDLVVVVGAGGPPLALELDAAGVLEVGDPLDDGGLPAVQRGGAGAQLAGHPAVRAGDLSHYGDHDHRDD